MIHIIADENDGSHQFEVVALLFILGKICTSPDARRVLLVKLNEVDQSFDETAFS